MSQQIIFFRLSHGEISEQAKEQCSQLYPSIWAEPPWNEIFFPKEVLQDIVCVSRKDCSEIILAYQNNSVVGFSWGYEINLDNLLDISGQEKLCLALENSGRLFYVNELGIAATHRQKGIGRRLTSLLLESAQAFGMQTILLRTDKQAVAARKLYRKLEFQELPFADKAHPSRTYWQLNLS
jgi:ribosomal protein S18 acetylase RimI-like enzyme